MIRQNQASCNTGNWPTGRGAAVLRMNRFVPPIRTGVCTAGEVVWLSAVNDFLRLTLANSGTHELQHPPSGNWIIWESTMSAGIDQQSPEITGLAAANNSLALVDAAFMPTARLRRPATLWFLAVVSLGAAAAAGVTVAGGLSTAGISEPSVSAGTSSAITVSSTADQVPPGMYSAVQTVILRGQPPTKAGRHL